MPGTGTGQAITTADHPPRAAGVGPARLLDVTRLASRAGRVQTGIDRVEAAWLDALLANEAPLWGLARIAAGYVLLDRAGLQALRDRLIGAAPWGRPHPLFRLARRLTLQQQGAQSDLWRAARVTCLRAGLGAMLRRHLPAGLIYLNIGHSNLTPRVMQAVRGVPQARVTVFLHDTIPLDFPQFQRPGSVARFRALLDSATQADLILCNSRATEADLRRHMPAPPAIHAVPLGVTMPAPDPAALTTQCPQMPPKAPYFLVTGTIEPRKNHALLLDVWQALADKLPEDHMPALLICGSRGWANEALFHRLDTSPLMGRHVFELPGLDDSALAALTAGARACLFPSLAEGYGLPAAEAAAAGRPLICSDLAVLREILKDYPVYLPASDLRGWTETIEEQVKQGTGIVNSSISGHHYRPHGWRDHFFVALKLT
ncbi:glycosyltransferase family 4 protein [Pseudooceanicola algae]|uniref:D-inositol-3-phosphate glycosyltransferase n=1 Tax=Pseudooceanicola algae TaxID=1537215 RepID=A0A418SBB1_9RHOB|nr:glycosyltransferase family 1 protein [Pseudooceanicola algae]QPM91404.1 D-inositol-3-phosphate glycosyltransferase [Pseudooceanicola algae]